MLAAPPAEAGVEASSHRPQHVVNHRPAYTITLPAGSAVVMGEPSLLNFTITNIDRSPATERISKISLIAPYPVADAVPPPGWKVTDITGNKVLFDTELPYAAPPPGCSGTALGNGQSAVFGVYVIATAQPGESTTDTLSGATVGNDCNTPGLMRYTFNRSGSFPTWSRRGLGATLIAAPNTVGIGETITLTMSVTNRTTEAQHAVAPVIDPTVNGTGGVTKLSGPIPHSADLTAGGSRNFVWTYQATSAGGVTFTAKASNTRTRTLHTSSNRVRIGAFTASLSASPAEQGSGGQITVTMAVTNHEGSALSAVAPSALSPGGTATTALVSGPTPSSYASLGPGESASFRWTYTVTGSTGANFRFAGHASASGGLVSNTPTSNAGRVSTVLVSASPSQIPAMRAATIDYTVDNHSGHPIRRVVITAPNTSFVYSSGAAPSGWSVSSWGSPTAVVFQSGGGGNDLASGHSASFAITWSAVPSAVNRYHFTVDMTTRDGGLMYTRSASISITPHLLTISASPSTILGDGASTSTLTVTLTSGGSPVSGATITLTNTLGTLSAVTLITNASGQGRVPATGLPPTLTSAPVGADRIATVTATSEGGATAQTSVTFLGIVLSVSASPSSIVADGVSTSTITVSLKTTTNAPVAQTVSLNTTRGSWSGGGFTTTVFTTGGSAAAILTSSASKSTVSATVTATYVGLAPKQTSVTFTAITIPEVGYLSGKAGNGSITLNWANPSQYFTGLLIVRRSGAAPTTSPTDGVSYGVGDLVGDATVVFNGVATGLSESGLINDITDYYYRVYVYYGTDLLYSAGTTLDLRPTSGGPGRPIWSYGLAGGSLLDGATPDFGNNLYQSAGTNRMVGLTQSEGDQLWAPVNTQANLTGDITWVPVSGSGSTVNDLVAGDQSGRLYAIDAATGAPVWGPLVLPGAEAIEAAPVVQLGDASNPAFQAQYGATTDVVFVVSKNISSTTNNRVSAVRLSDGAMLWQFNASGSVQMDGSLGSAWIDYGRNRLYVVTRAGITGTQPSLWTLDSLTGSLIGSLALGHIESAPVQRDDQSSLYVGTTSGTLEAIDLTGPVPVRKWSGPAALGGAINGFIGEDLITPGLLYFSTQDGFVWALQDPGAGVPPNTASPVWKQAITGPSAPLILDSTLLVGSADGRLYELSLTDGATLGQVIVGNGLAQVGTPSATSETDVYVGTSTGKLFRYTLPLP